MAPASTTSAPISAPDILSPSSPSLSSSSGSQFPNTRNPLPLSAAQEAQVRDIYYKRVRGYCAEEVKGTLSHIFFLLNIYPEVPRIVTSTNIDFKALSH